MSTKTIRELGGEIWAELNSARESPASTLGALNWKQTIAISEFVMSVLARHVGVRLIQDEGLEVSPLPTEPSPVPPSSPSSPGTT